MNRLNSIFAGLFCLVASLAGAPQAQAQTTTVEYLHTDALGTPVAVTDAAGVVIERSEYEPYGQLVNRPLTDGPGFTGHVQDAATGLTYMQQRYYDPTIGRFLSVDPVTAYSSPGANFNRYWYANNNPYKFVDPDGRQSRAEAKRQRDRENFCGVSGCDAGSYSSDEEGAKSSSEGASQPARPYFWSGYNLLSGPGSLTDFGSLWDAVFPPLLFSPAGNGVKVAGFGFLTFRAAGKAQHLVLGLRNFGLEETAARVGGQTLLKDPAWRQTLVTALGNPSARFTVSVEGLAGTSVYSKIMGAVTRPGASATNWELSQLAQAGRLGEVRFVDRAGNLLPNPF
ncbi:RHS repeat-associated core domain-containing protein [Pseudoxanthomonas sp.]|uniref:RHS repeat-associated core domain-containing protein n=1 Tax=Pseudoxanthomonas sp. TaxID=1871049 RepID=UPI003F7FEC68